MTAKDFIEQTYWVKSRQSTFPLMNEVIAKTEEYGKQQYNQCLYDLIADDLLPDKEKNLKKYMK